MNVAISNKDPNPAEKAVVQSRRLSTIFAALGLPGRRERLIG